MWTIRCSDVSSFLREGSFFQSLDLEDQEVFEVPEDCFKLDLFIDCDHDLISVLRTVQYWDLPEVPIEVASYILRIGDVADYPGLLVDFPDLAPYLNKILQVKSVRYCDGISTAINHGLGVRIVRILRELEYVLSGEGCEAAAAAGDIESLMYLHTEDCPWDERTTTAAVLHKHCDCLQYALDFNCAKVANLMDIAAKEGTVDVMKCIRSCCVLWTKSTMLAAIKGGNLENVRFLVESGCAMPVDPCFLATACGHLNILIYLHVCGHPLSPLCTFIAADGHLPCLVYLHTQGCAWDARCCCQAALGDHLDCLTYLHENGCVWDQTTTTAAIARKSWKCLQYAVQHGCSVMWLYILVGNVGVLLCRAIFAYYRERTSEKWLEVYDLDLSMILMSFATVLETLNDKFGRYYTHYISIDTAKKIVSRFGCVSTVLATMLLLHFFVFTI